MKTDKVYTNAKYHGDLKQTHLVLLDSCIVVMERQSRNLGHALRCHNALPHVEKMLFQDVMRDAESFRYDLTRETMAAVCSTKSMLAAGHVAHAFYNVIGEKRVNGYGATLTEKAYFQRMNGALDTIRSHWDIDDDILFCCGYNVYGAEKCGYYRLKKREAIFAQFRQFLTTMSSTQVYQGKEARMGQALDAG